MSDERRSDGPTQDEMIRLIRDAFPEAVVAEIDSAAFFSLDEKHWPNFATIVWTDEHDEGAPSNLARPGVYRVNVGVDRPTYERMVGGMTDPTTLPSTDSSRIRSTLGSAGSRSSTRATRPSAMRSCRSSPPAMTGCSVADEPASSLPSDVRGHQGAKRARIGDDSG
jgi:hypothetical protein